MSAKQIEAVIVPRAHDIGAFAVRRSLPAKARRAIGPFVFLDGFGPARLPADKALDVRPHPHIGLATITWLLSGEILHRDSLGNTQPIRPGECNWMTAGRGIVHSERSPDHLRGKAQEIFGMQAWIGLPRDKEEVAPAFTHIPAAALPRIDTAGFSAVVIAGAAWGLVSPVEVQSPTFYAEVTVKPGGSVALPAEIAERGIYTLEGEAEIDGQDFAPHHLIALAAGSELAVKSAQGARFMVLGGAPLDGPRHLFWNFVSSSKERIERAKEDWKAGRFAKVPGDEEEFIPLPN